MTFRRMMRDRARPLAGGLLALILGGCASILPHAPSPRATQEEHQAHAQRAHPWAPLTRSRQPYLIGTGFALRARRPAWLRQTVTVRTARPVLIYQAAELIARAAGVPVSVRALSLPVTGGSSMALTTMPGIRIPGTVTARLSYHGPLTGLLDRVANQYGVYWRVRHGAIRLFRFESRTYRLSVSGQSETVSNTIAATGGVGSLNGGGGGLTGSTGASGSSLGSGSLSIKQSGTIDPYKDVLAGLKSVIDASSGGGLVVTGPSLGVVTVLAPPPVQALVRAYVHQQDREAEQNIAVTVRVYQVTVTRTNTLGGSLNAAFQTLHKNLAATVAGVTIPSAAGTGLSSLSLIVPNNATGTAEHTAGSNAIVQALASVGQVRLVTSGSAITGNGQPAPIQVANQVGYLASEGSTLSANVGSTSTLTPGTVTVGFTSNFLPRLLGGQRILLQYALQLSSLVSLDTVSSGGNSIQVPTISEQSASQSVVLKNGETLVLAGFGQTQKKRNNGVGLLSGYATHDSTRDWMVIIIHINEVRA